jgi:hypothetical protein
MKFLLPCNTSDGGGNEGNMTYYRSPSSVLQVKRNIMHSTTENPSALCLQQENSK